jgi:tight adherence protein B
MSGSELGHDAPIHRKSDRVATVNTYMLFILVVVAMGGVAWVFVYPMLSGERNAERRMASVARSQPVAARRPARAAQKSRREQIEGTLKEIEDRRKKAKRPPLSVRIAQAGLTWSKQRFMLTAGGLGLVVFVLVLLAKVGFLPALGAGFAAGCGLPLWALSFLKKRREARFLDALPDAVDVIVRGIKSGLPLLDSLKLIAGEAEEPIRSEFRGIIETQTIGMPLGEACLKLYERMPVPEANFFGIVISIQQRAGGNLSEALGNLSRVLRDRKKMKAKIQAMSMEAKASAGIIGALPPAVMTLVYITSPQYISLLWTEPLGRLMLACCVVWMSIGIFVMRKMINFDF